MWEFPSHASGIIIIMAWGSVRPVWTRNSSAWSKMAESLPSGLMMGNSFFRSVPNAADCMVFSRALIQLMLPRSVLISPLWQRMRKGCASSQLGKVLVLYRAWTSAMAERKSGSAKSG